MKSKTLKTLKIMKSNDVEQINDLNIGNLGISYDEMVFSYRLISKAISIFLNNFNYDFDIKIIKDELMSCVIIKRGQLSYKIEIKYSSFSENLKIYRVSAIFRLNEDMFFISINQAAKCLVSLEQASLNLKRQVDFTYFIN